MDEEDKRRAKKDGYENLGWLSWAFTLAVISIAVTDIRIIDVIISALFAVVLFFFGCKAFKRAKNVKV